MKKTTIFFVSFALVASAVPALAQTTSSTADTIQPLLNQIQALQQQINQLQQQINQAQQQKQQVVSNLISSMGQGSSGDQVKVLQALLAMDPSVYPEGKITGFFGQLTANAVKRYQKKHGLPQVGVVGPKTLQILSEELRDNPIALEPASSTQSTSTIGETEREEKRPCAIVPPGHLIAPGWLRKHGGESPIVPTCQTLPPGIWSKLQGVSTSTASSTVDLVPPVISSVVSSVSTSSATISWTTNEPATSQVFYGVTLALASSTALDSSLVTNHSQTISGLVASTTYYYSVQSKDGSGNVATSTQQSFTTASQ
jgi:peptidoglycan hydrolase-like protein with peptidoglycan-binding domain